MPNSPDENTFPSPAGRAERSGLSRLMVLDYFNPGMVRGRFRRFLSNREKMVEAAKTLGWVIPLTLLIWIYAEREQVVQPNSPNALNVVVTITSSDKDLYVESVGAGPPTVNLQLTGPQQAVEKVKEILSMRIPAGPGLKIDVGSMAVGKDEPVRVVDNIQNLDIFKSNGVTVQESQPPELKVNVDRMLRREVPVQIPPGASNLAAESHFEPAKVILSGPAELVSKIDAVYPKLDGVDVLTQPGNHTIPSVLVGPATPSEKLSVSPPQVTAEVVVHVMDKTYTIPDPVPIYVQILETTLVNNDFVLSNGDSSLAGVTVTGPAAMIDQIQSGKFQVKAVLEVDGGDTGNTAVPKTLDFVLPPGVKVSDADARRTVEYKLSHH
jgi:hypothetical protein